MLSILLVDDEKLTLDYLSMAIPKQDDSWTVLKTCYDGISALEWLKENLVDLVITDIKMPEMTGLELSQEILKIKPQQKIIILTGYDEFQFAQQALKYGVKDYLLKPISLPDLKESLKEMKKALMADQAEESMYHTLLSISQEGKNQIVSRFMQAVIRNSYVEIKSLHPVVHRLKINLLDGAGILLLISLDEDILLSQGIPVSDIPLFKYILYRLTLELAETYPANLWISLDDNEDVVVLLSAETYSAATHITADFLWEIRKNKFTHMELSLSAGQSAAFEDILMINEAYLEAVTALNSRIFGQPNHLYRYTSLNDTTNVRIQKLDNYIHGLHAALLKADISEQMLLSHAMITLFSEDTQRTRIVLGLYLMKQLTSLQMRPNADETMYQVEALLPLAAEPELPFPDFLFKLTRLLTPRQPTAASADHNPSETGIVQKAQAYIHKHYASPISLAVIAEEIGVSPNYLSTMFHNEAGESYIKYLTKIRMENAVNFMRNYPDMKIYEIAEKVGYVNVKHFSYVFKQAYCVSPGEYQQKIR